MPSKDERKFKELLGELSFFNKLAKKGKGLFTSRDKALTHAEDCPCIECKLNRTTTMNMPSTNNVKNWEEHRG